MRQPPGRAAAVAIGVIVTFLWATSVVLIRLGLTEEAVDPIGFAGVRFTLAALILRAPGAATAAGGPRVASESPSASRCRQSTAC